MDARFIVLLLVSPQLRLEEMDQSKEYALRQDEKDELRHLRKEFIVPSKAALKRSTLVATGG